MNAIVPIEPAPTHGPHGEGRTVLTPSLQAEFLKSLQLFGNVRLACRAASCSAQTAYRARRRSSGFARAWDAALLAARASAEATLADRAINGVEEAVFYHGEEVARRRRYSDRLLLAHLARLDRLEEKPEIAAELDVLDERIEALERGEELAAARSREELAQECVPPVPLCRECGEQSDTLDEEDLCACCVTWVERVLAMHDARPADAPSIEEQAEALGMEPLALEELQLSAYEARRQEWWLFTGKDGKGAFVW